MLYTLKALDYDAEGFINSEELFKALETKKAGLITLDIMLPGDDGIEILKKLRQNHYYQDIPVIITTAKNSEYDKVNDLDLGADDYLVKPFGMLEMASGIKAVLRRSKTDSKKILNNGDPVIDELNYQVFIKNNEINLTLKEYDLLKLFMENIGRVFTRDELMSLIWGTDYIGETRTTDVHIGTLCSKLLNYGSLIKTVHGVGYKMVDEYEKEDR